LCCSPFYGSDHITAQECIIRSWKIHIPSTEVHRPRCVLNARHLVANELKFSLQFRTGRLPGKLPGNLPGRIAIDWEWFGMRYCESPGNLPGCLPGHTQKYRSSVCRPHLSTLPHPLETVLHHGKRKRGQYQRGTGTGDKCGKESPRDFTDFHRLKFCVNPHLISVNLWSRNRRSVLRANTDTHGLEGINTDMNI
jgi:hypothetical protein